jgi:2-methylcitrate dehydratase
MKAFPSEALTHSPISAVIRLIKHNRINKRDIEQVTIRTVARAADILSDPSKYDPRSRETADHSLPYCIAATIVDGNVTLASFKKEKIMDPELRSYLDKINVVIDPKYEKTFPELKKCSVQIKTNDGHLFDIEVDYPLGDYREPMDDIALYAKFDSMVLPETGQKRRDRIVSTILNLEKVQDISEFTNLLAK